jgi:AcrR family transcriptional regulator
VGVAERREREREHLRGQVIDAARDLLLEQGLAGLSMRAIAERIEYSPATIYLYFKDKDELVREVVHTGFELLTGQVERERARLTEGAGAAEQYSAMGRAYARFAVENPAYFRIMFELPGTAELRCHEPSEHEKVGFDRAVEMVQGAVETGEFGAVDPARSAVVGWGVIHGLTTLYLSGHLGDRVASPEAFYELIEYAMGSLYSGWKPANGCEGDG